MIMFIYRGNCTSCPVVSACSFIDDCLIRRVPSLCSTHLDRHGLLLSPTYVKSHDLHLNLYKIVAMHGSFKIIISALKASLLALLFLFLCFSSV